MAKRSRICVPRYRDALGRFKAAPKRRKGSQKR